MSPARPPEPERSTRIHLVAALGAALVLLAFGAGFSVWGRRLEGESLVELLPVFAEPKEHAEGDPGSVNYIEHLKNQGVALQRRAFERDDMLPLYGSSELVKRIPDKASLFFRTAPTGFSVFPVGKAGTTSLIILQKLASLGNVTADKRVAISLSPSWFFTELPQERPYRGNFSRQQAFGALLNRRLTFGFKRDLARRLLLHPLTLKSDALLRFLVTRLARGGRSDRAAYAAVWPLAELHLGLFSAQDHFENALYIVRHPLKKSRALTPSPTSLDWDRLIADASSQPSPAFEEPAVYPRSFRKIGNDEAFRERIALAAEWDDLELLLRGMHEMGIVPLILCMPPNGVYFEHGGVSKESLDLFAARIRGVAEHSGAQVEAFEDHEEDVDFLVDHHDHMSAKGWMYYNRALDEFYHTDRGQLERAFAKGHRKHPRPAPFVGHS